MLDWMTVRLALEFLDKAEDAICLQVPDFEHVEALNLFIIRYAPGILGDRLIECSEKFVSKKGSIYIEVASTGHAGLEHDCPTFLVENVHTYKEMFNVNDEQGRKEDSQVQGSCASPRLPGECASL